MKTYTASLLVAPRDGITPDDVLGAAVSAANVLTIVEASSAVRVHGDQVSIRVTYYALNGNEAHVTATEAAEGTVSLLRSAPVVEGLREGRR